MWDEGLQEANRREVRPAESGGDQARWPAASQWENSSFQDLGLEGGAKKSQTTLWFKSLLQSQKREVRARPLPVRLAGWVADCATTIPKASSSQTPGTGEPSSPT